jgi:hypothetical protein
MQETRIRTYHYSSTSSMFMRLRFLGDRSLRLVLSSPLDESRCMGGAPPGGMPYEGPPMMDAGDDAMGGS